MNRGLSLYLDALRFLAALTVLLVHASGQRFTAGLFWQLRPYGQEAVLVFFVLSGFVIGYVTDTRERSAAVYAISRLSRIYSVALPALVLTVVLDAIGQVTGPVLYPPGILGGISATLASVLFLNQIWRFDFWPGSDIAWWSLGYECWYYVIFGVLLYARPPWNRVGAALLLVFVGPRVASLFPLWLLGVGGYRLCCRGLLSRGAGIGLAAGATAAWIGFEWLGFRLGYRPDFSEITFHRGELVQDYGLGLLVTAQLIGVHAACAGRSPASWLERPVHFLAQRTFSLYLYHVPVSQVLITLLPFPPGSAAGRVAILAGTIGVVFLLAEVTEMRKGPWRRAFAWCVMARREPVKTLL